MYTYIDLGTTYIGVSICKFLLGIQTHAAPVKSIYCFNEVRYLHMHAFTCTYVQCTYAYVHVRMLYCVCCMLHVYERII